MPAEPADIRAMLRNQACDYMKRVSSREDDALAGDPERLMSMFRDLGNTGYTSILIPAHFGGDGGGLREACIVVEEVAAGQPTLALMLTNHLSCARALVLWSGEAQKRSFLPPLCSGEHLGGVAITEPEAGTDLSSLKAAMRKQGDQLILNGNKCFVTNTGPGIDAYVMGFFSAPSGLACVLIDTSTPGFHLAHAYVFAGWDGLPNHAIVLQDCVVPLDNLIAEGVSKEEFDGWRDGSLILTSAVAAGMARQCMEEASLYCRERRQCGKRIIEHQFLLFRLADMSTSIELIRTSLQRAASRVDGGLPSHAEACMLKLFATGELEAVASSAMEMAGGYGYTDDSRLSSLYRYAKGLQLFWGSRESMYLEIASSLGL